LFFGQGELLAGLHGTFSMSIVAGTIPQAKERFRVCCFAPPRNFYVLLMDQDPAAQAKAKETFFQD
jgi:uracil DNA glycosylase